MAQPTKINRVFSKIVDVKPDEIRALWLGFVFNFMVLGGYYVIRPIRDEIGASSGVENLPWMFTATLGAIIGGSITAWLVKPIGAANLLLVSGIMFEVAAQSVRFFPADFARGQQTSQDRRAEDAAIGGSLWSGITHIFRSPYLFGLFAFIIFYSTTSTWAYFQQSDLAGHGFADRAARTTFFANLDRSVNTLTLLGQLFLTGRLLKWLGVTSTLIIMPALSLIGFVFIGVTPLLAVLAVFQVLRRAATFAFMRPAREVLFTVLRREDKYKAKSVIDTFAYRVGDQIGAWSYRGFHSAGLGLSAISFIAVPVIAVWCVLSLWLGRRQAALADDRVKTTHDEP